MILSIIKRFEAVRNNEGLNKSQFEKRLNKSSGYLNMLKKRDSNPGVDVIEKFNQEFPDYSLNWLISGNGEMLKSIENENIANDPAAEYSIKDLKMMHSDIKMMRSDLKEDLKSIAEGMIKNFEVISTGIMQGLMDQRKLLDIAEKIDADKIKKTSEDLDEFLKQKQEK